MGYTLVSFYVMICLIYTIEGEVFPMKQIKKCLFFFLCCILLSCFGCTYSSSNVNITPTPKGTFPFETFPIFESPSLYFDFSNSSPKSTVPPTPKSTPVPSNPPTTTVVYITETGAKYHRVTCRYLKKSMYEISLSRAVAQGYTPCSVCKPPRL